MNFKSQQHENDKIYNLNEVISSISVKSDFEKLESEFFNSISSLIPAHATALYLFNSNKQNPSYISGKGIDTDFISYYEKEGREVDPLRSWIMQKRSANHSQLLFGLKGWRQHPVYDVVKTAKIDFAMQSPIINGNNIIGTINFGRDLVEGPFNKLDVCLISILSHFLGLAIINSFGAQNYDDYNLRFYSLLDNMNQGMLLADEQYNIHYKNKAAKEVINKHMGIGESQNMFKKFLIPDHNNDTTISSNVHNSFKIRSCPLPGTRKKTNIVFIDEIPPPQISLKVREILTNREVDILMLLERGMQNKQIADKLNISINTVKRHLDNMFGKFNVNSRTQFISKFYQLNNMK